MDFLGILELVIGIVFIYFILGLVCSVIREILANLMNLRAKNLEAWLRDTFREELSSKLLKHKLIDGLKSRGRKASYYPTRVFVNALLDQINTEKGEEGPYNIDTIKEKIVSSDLLPGDFKRTLLQSISESRGDLIRFKKDVGNWFDQAMIRISGTYKKHTQKALVLISFIVVLVFNADTISMSKYFHDNPVHRKAMVDQIDRMAEQGELEDSLKSYDLPLGWDTVTFLQFQSTPGKLGWLLSKISGLLLSALAISIGAPFWFDVLNKVVNLRASGNHPKT